MSPWAWRQSYSTSVHSSDIGWGVIEMRLREMRGDRNYSHGKDLALFFLKFGFNWRKIALQLVMVSAIQQCKSAMIMYIYVCVFTSSWTSLPSHILHFLVWAVLCSQGRGTCVLSCFSCVWLCETIWTVAHQAPLSMGFSRRESWNGLPFPMPGDLPDPGIEPTSVLSPALAGRFFTTSTI